MLFIDNEAENDSDNETEDDQDSEVTISIDDGNEYTPLIDRETERLDGNTSDSDSSDFIGELNVENNDGRLEDTVTGHGSQVVDAEDIYEKPISNFERRYPGRKDVHLRNGTKLRLQGTSAYLTLPPVMTQRYEKQ